MPETSSFDNMRGREAQQQRQRDSQQRQQSRVQYRPLFGNTMECPNCHEEVARNLELCPHCGHPLHTGTCTYCGSPMEPDDLFCSECGGSRRGVTCPQCGTLNFRSFCRTCNSPLDELAQQELERAKHDPVFMKMSVLAQRMAELEEKLIQAAAARKEAQGEEAGEEEPVADFSQAAELTEEEKALVEQYKQMMAQLGLPPVETPKAEPPKAQPTKPKKPKERQTLKVEDHKKNIAALKDEYTKGLQEMNDLMRQLIPDPGSTPQVQRNYYSARKLAVRHAEVVRECVGWVCNLCGCQHKQPSECAQPELGGTWIYKDVVTESWTYE